MKANLVEKMKDREYSSFKDYCGLRDETVCNKDLAIQLLDLNMKTFTKILTGSLKLMI
jgi:putative transposase